VICHIGDLSYYVMYNIFLKKYKIIIIKAPTHTVYIYIYPIYHGILLGQNSWVISWEMGMGHGNWRQLDGYSVSLALITMDTPRTKWTSHL